VPTNARVLADTSATSAMADSKIFSRTPEFVLLLVVQMSDLLLVNKREAESAGDVSYYNWIRRNVAANTPWDVMARNLVTRGSTAGKRRRKFFVLHEDPKILAETTSIAFMGLSSIARSATTIRWRSGRTISIRVANLFARVRIKNAPGDGNASSSVRPKATSSSRSPEIAATGCRSYGKVMSDRFARRPSANSSRTGWSPRDNPYFYACDH